MPLLQARNLHKTYRLGRHNVVRALRGVDIAVEAGEMVAIMGPSGSGKSTLMHILGLLQPPDREAAPPAELTFDGTDLSRLSDRERTLMRARTMGFVFQSFNLVSTLTAEENVALSSEYAGQPRSKARVAAVEALTWVGLAERAAHLPAELSGGMRKRVGLARAICMRPQIMLYDEPTTGVDPIMGDAIKDLIRELHNKLKVTGIAVTHDMTSAYKIADRIAMLYNGKIIANGTSDEIKNAKDPIVRQFITAASKGPITEGIDFEHLV